jgi:hypothetical protein
MTGVLQRLQSRCHPFGQITGGGMGWVRQSQLRQSWIYRYRHLRGLPF